MLLGRRSRGEKKSMTVMEHMTEVWDPSGTWELCIAIHDYSMS